VTATLSTADSIPFAASQGNGRALDPLRFALADESTATSESKLLRRLRAGEERAFEEVVRDCGGRMLATARRILRSEDDAREAVQDAFLSAVRALPEFAGGSRLSTWIHRILINAALQKLRARRRHPEESIEDLLPRFDLDGRRCEGPLNSFEDCESRLERAELCVLVRECIGRLPDKFRIVLVLRDIEEIDTEGTSVLLGLRPQAVRTRLHRARQALRTLLARELTAGGTRLSVSRHVRSSSGDVFRASASKETNASHERSRSTP